MKKFGGETVIPGNILVRQRGTKMHPGTGVGMGIDHTIFAKRTGVVKFRWSKMKKRQVVSVVDPEPLPTVAQ